MIRLQELICSIFGHNFYQPWELEGGYRCKRCGIQLEFPKVITGRRQEGKEVGGRNDK